MEEDRWPRGESSSQPRERRHRSRSRSPRRRRSTSRSRSPRRGDNRDRDRSRDKDRDRDRDRDRDEHERGRGSASNRLSEPSSSVILRNMPTKATEADLAPLLGDSGYHSIRIIRDRDNGQSRGFGFVDFSSVADAERFVRNNNERLKVFGSVVNMDFSQGQRQLESRSERTRERGLDWICGNFGCEGYNFARRGTCFQCGNPKTETAEDIYPDDPRAQGGGGSGGGGGGVDKSPPSTTVVLRGLHPMTTEDTIRYAMSCHGPVVDIRLVREKGTNISRGLCFVEYESIAVSSNAVRACIGGCIIDNTNVRVTFSRDGNNVEEDDRKGRGDKRGKRGSGSAPQRPPNISEGFSWDEKSSLWFDPSSGFYYDSTTQLYYHAQSAIYYRWNIMSGTYMQVDERGVRVEDAAAEKQKAEEEEKKRKKEAKRHAKVVEVAPASAEVSELVVKKKPELAGKGTGMLGGIKFNLNAVKTSVAADLNKWNERKTELVGAVETAPASSNPASSSSSVFVSSPFISAAPVLSAPEVLAASARAPGSPEAKRTAAPTAGPPAVTLPLSMSAGGDAGGGSWSGSVSTSEVTTATVDAGDSSIPENKVVRNKWINIKTIQCLLCQRQFKELPTLMRHVDESALHKKNMQIEEFKVIQKEQAAQAARTVQQAKNIKMKENKFEQMVLEAAKREEERLAEESRNKVNVPIEDTNKGNKMLKAMGWKEGTGLGKNEAGIKVPVQAELRAEGAGIGVAGAEISGGGADYNKAATRARTFERFNDESRGPAPQSKEKEDAAAEYLRMMQAHNSTSCSSDRENRPLVK